MLPLALLLGGALVAVRGAGLFDRAALLAGAGEGEWFAWAHRHGDLGPRFASIRARLVPGESVLVVLPPVAEDTGWWRVMTLYYLPEQRLAGVVRPTEARRFPGNLARLFVDTAGEIELVTPGARSANRSR